MTDSRNMEGNTEDQIRNLIYRKQDSSPQLATMPKGLKTKLEESLVARDSTS